MRHILFVAYEGVQALDVFGPAEVFTVAERCLKHPVYRTGVASVGGARIKTSSSVQISTRDLRKIRPERVDTVIVAGAQEGPVRSAASNPELLAWLRRAHPRSRRLASVCSGAFVLAATGVLDGKRATTHWSALDQLAKFRPAVNVDRSAIFVRDGSVWTSAGVSTGIDMALAMVEEDVGRRVADLIAGQLVLYLRRPGFQSQFSNTLIAQGGSADPLGQVIAWARAHIDCADVGALAQRAGVSLRTFHRRCLEHVHTTPARLLEKLRVEYARTLLTTTTMPVKALAARAGFGNPARMKRAFQRELGISARDYRLLF